jgi:hypothetical protein
MIISKATGEKLSNESMKTIYGGDCSVDCGSCDCSISGGVLFFSNWQADLPVWESLYHYGGT